jgi:amino acid transporter
MDLNLILIVIVAILVTSAVLLRLVAPRAYRRYVLRIASEPVGQDQRSSRLGAIAALIILVFICVHLGAHIFTEHQSVLHESESNSGTSMEIGAWIALLCVSATGVALCLFPTFVITRVSKMQSILSSADKRETRTLKTFGRALGFLFLVVAVLIARRLL